MGGKGGGIQVCLRICGYPDLPKDLRPSTPAAAPCVMPGERVEETIWGRAVMGRVLCNTIGVAITVVHFCPLLLLHGDLEAP